MTAVAVVRHNEHAVHEFIDTTHVVFRRLDAGDHRALRGTRRCRSTAPAASRARGSASALCESIDSADPSALIGLPLIRLSAVLRSVGFELP